MEIILGIFIVIPFFYINYRIINIDLKEKLIPNKYLQYLFYILPFIYVYFGFYGYFSDLSFFKLFLETLFTLIIGFLLYHFGKWGAGDAKYFITLSLFLSSFGSITFLGNISLVILCFFIISYISFYSHTFIRLLYGKSDIRLNITTDLRAKIHNYFYKQSIKKIFISLSTFLVIFIALRSYRIYFIDYILNQNINNSLLIIYMSIGIFIGILCYILYIKYKNKIPYFSEGIFLLFIIIFLCFFIYEYINDTENFLGLIYKILTFYFIIFLIIRCIKYSVNIFIGQDYYHKSISQIKEQDIIERNDFNKKILPLIGNKKNVFTFYQIPLYGNITITKEIKANLMSLLRSINKYNRKEYLGSSVIEDLKCMRVIAFAPYIFLGFTLTFLFQGKILDYIFSFIFSLFQ